VNLRLAITLLVAASWACSPSVKGKSAPDWRQVPASIELRLAEGAPAAGLAPWAVYGQPKTVYLYSEALLSNSDIARVEPVVTRIRAGLVLDVWLTQAGAVRLKQMTGRHVGDSLAVLIDSVVVAIPVIRQPMGGDPKLPFTMGVPLGPKEAQQLAAAVRKTWPPAQTSR
jgi:preprotein translocase subunit SecD